jgi:hypothetical protein
MPQRGAGKIGGTEGGYVRTPSFWAFLPPVWTGCVISSSIAQVVIGAIDPAVRRYPSEAARVPLLQSYVLSLFVTTIVGVFIVSWLLDNWAEIRVTPGTSAAIVFFSVLSGLVTRFVLTAYLTSASARTQSPLGTGVVGAGLLYTLGTSLVGGIVSYRVFRALTVPSVAGASPAFAEPSPTPAVRGGRPRRPMSERGQLRLAGVLFAASAGLFIFVAIRAFG